MDSYRKIIGASGQGAGLRYSYQKYGMEVDGKAEICAEYLLRGDGSLYGRGRFVFSVGHPLQYENRQDFVLIDTEVADLNEGYMLKRNGELYCVYPGESSQRILVPGSQSAKDRPVLVMEHARQHLFSHPNEFVVMQDGFVYGWGRNWRGSLGVPGLPENILQPVFVTDSIIELRCGKMYQTFALKEDRSIWHWSPEHGQYKPARLEQIVSARLFQPASEIILWLTDDDDLFYLSNDCDYHSDIASRKEKLLSSGIRSFSATQYLIAADHNDGALVLWSLFRRNMPVPLKEIPCLAGVVQYLVADETVVALDRSGKLYRIVHYFVGNESMLAVDLLSDDIVRIDCLRTCGITPFGVYAANQEGQLVSFSWCTPFERKTIYHNPALQTLEDGRFVVCPDGSVWEKENA